MAGAGDYPDRVTLERLQDTNLGERFMPLAIAANVWARVEAQDAEAVFIVAIRFRADLKDLRDAAPGMRVLHGDRILIVDHVIEVDPRVETHLVCHDVIPEAPSLATGGKRVKPWSG